MRKTLQKRRTICVTKPNSDVTPTKVRKKEISIEQLSKQKLLEKFKVLEDDYTKLVALNERTVKENKCLKDNLTEMEKQVHVKCQSEPGKVETSETQTSDDRGEIQFSCNDCIYNAIREKELRWHVFHSHNKGNPEVKLNFFCKVCFRSFESKNELMRHMKIQHKELVPECRYYKNGECNFNESKCWFHHKDGANSSSERKKYKCNFCENKFEAKDDLMNHRKYQHSYTVPECKNIKENTCKFGKECWYKHV